MQKKLYVMAENHLNNIIQMPIYDLNNIGFRKSYKLIKNYSLEKQIKIYNLFSTGNSENNFHNSIFNLTKIPYYEYHNIKKRIDYNYSFVQKKCKELNLNIDISKYKRIMTGVTLYDQNITQKSILSGNLYSLTYAFDDLLDSKQININDKNDVILFLNNFLSCKNYDYSKIKNNNIKEITEFICENFIETYPQNKFTFLYEIMYLFHSSQIKEKEISNNICSENENEWYKYIILKSLLSRLSAMVLYKSNITDSEINNIITICPLIQLRDDLEDFGEDIKENNVTPFNAHILKNYHMLNDPFTVLLKNTSLIINNNNNNKELLEMKIIETLMKYQKNKIKNECQYNLNLDINEKYLNLLLKIYDQINLKKSFLF